MKLRYKLLVSYIIVGLLPLLAIGAYAHLSLRDEKFQSLSDFFLAQLRQIDLSLTSFLADVEADVESLAHNSAVRVRDAADFTNFVQADEATFEYAIGDAEQRIIDVFANYRTYHEYANSVYMGRDNGAFVRSHPRIRPTQYDPRERPWYQLALSHPQQVMRTAPYQSVTTDDINVGIVKALSDDDGTVFGVVGVDITLRNLTTIVSHIQTGMQGAIVLLDADGILLTNPVPERRFQHYRDVGLNAFDDVMAFQSGSVRFLDQGLAWYAFFYTSPELGWKICALVPASEVDREMTAFLRTILLILALTLVAGVIQAYVLSRQVTAPLNGLMRGIRRLGEHMQQRQAFEKIAVPAGEEVAAVVDTLNAMGEELVATHQELRLYNENLEQMVAERTGQISRTNEQLRNEIADREQTEIELRQERNLLRTVIDHLPEFVYVKDTHSRFVLANRACVHSLGHDSLDSVIGKTDADVFPAREAENFYRAEQEVISSGMPFLNREETCTNVRTGKSMWLLTSKVPFCHPDGRIVGLVGLSLDITERKRAQAELWKLSRALEYSANSIIMTDLAGRIEFVNPAFTSITGYTLPEVLGQNPRILKSGRMSPEIYEDLWKTLQHGEVWKGELINRRKDGSFYWEFTTISPVKNEAGVTTHYVAVKEDISERKRMEDALRQATEAAMEAQQAAEDAQRVSDAANQAKSQFLANMSHELRTPLNGILGYAQILKMQRQLTEFQQKGIDIIERSGRHLLNLINDVLDISKIEARKIELTPTPFLFAAFLSDIVEMIRVQAERKGIEVKLELPHDLPIAVQADEKRLSQILINLLGNAVKFTEQGSVTLRILDSGFEILDLEDAQSNSSNLKSQISNLKFEILDTGIGIAPDDLEHIFSAFTQVGPSRAVEGTGLGLAISRELVRVMGGELQVRSTEGGGSTFWFELPLVIGDEQDVLHRSEGRRIVGFATRSGVSPRILVVDDKLENRALLMSLLLSLGFDAQEACDGHEGEVRALEFQPDLIFMDLIMPVIDGFEATRRLRRVSELADIKIIAVSASTLIPADHLRTEFGFDDYVPKPLQIHEVFEKLARHLELEWQYDELPGQHQAEADPPAIADIQHIPPKDGLALLDTLARDGNFTALRAYLDQLESSDSRYCVFVQKIRHLANTLDEDAIRELLAALL